MGNRQVSSKPDFKGLTDNVDFLDFTVNNPKSGLTPVLLRKLTEHSELVQEAADIQS
ncbi:ribosome biogenesis protein ytm1 [Leucoagaricus gongylophorus]